MKNRAKLLLTSTIIASLILVTSVSYSIAGNIRVEIAVGLSYINRVPTDLMQGHDQYNLGLALVVPIIDDWLELRTSYNHYSNGYGLKRIGLDIGTWPNVGFDSIGTQMVFIIQ